MTDITSEACVGKHGRCRQRFPGIADRRPTIAEGPAASTSSPASSCCSSPIAISPASPTPCSPQYGFGRAHHRVLHFVHRNPGLRVADLLDILKITKQSLARVLKQLVDEGFIIQRAGNDDRRERRLYLTAKGARLTDRLTQIQVKRIEAALAKLGPGADAVAGNFCLP